MEHSEQPNHPRGHFPLHLTITSNGCEKPDDTRESSTLNLTDILAQFITQASEHYALSVLTSPFGTPTRAEAIISVPFPDRERIRIDYNIFASDMEAQHGPHLYFHMESL